MTVTPSRLDRSTEVAKAGSQLGQWLEEYSEIAAILPVISGLLVTTQLRLRGASALAVNIAIAAIARQAIVQLKQQADASPPVALAPVTVNGAEARGNDQDYTILHSVPGRIRLQIPRLWSDATFAQRLEKLLLAQEQVVARVRINRAARSIVIRYNKADLTELELGLLLLQVLEQAEQSEATV